MEANTKYPGNYILQAIEEGNVSNRCMKAKGYYLVEVPKVAKEAQKHEEPSKQEGASRSNERTDYVPEKSEVKKDVKKEEWVEVKSFRGNGTKNTELFKITGNQWRISWSNKGRGNLGISVYKPKRDIVSFASGGPGSDTHYIYENGIYYLEVSGENWTIKVEELK